jgi:hypothetical protein
MKDNTNNIIDRLYANRFSSSEHILKIRLWKTLIASVLTDTIHPADTVIDLGAGSGEFLLACRAKSRIAIDPIAPMTLSKKGITVIRRSFTSCPKTLYNTANIIMLSNVLEHLRSPEEMIQVLTLAKRLLKSKGKIIIIQPVIDLVGSRYWDFLDHVLAITRNRLLEAMKVVHLKIHTYIPRFLPYTSKTKLPTYPWLLSLYLRIPWRLRPLAGQILIIVQK